MIMSPGEGESLFLFPGGLRIFPHPTAKASAKLSNKTVPINTLGMLNVNNFDGLFGTLFSL